LQGGPEGVVLGVDGRLGGWRTGVVIGRRIGGQDGCWDPGRSVIKCTWIGGVVGQGGEGGQRGRGWGLVVGRGR